VGQNWWEKRVNFQRESSWGLNQMKHGKQKRNSHVSFPEPTQFKPEELLRALFSATIENHPTITDCLEKLLVNQINNGNEQESFLALEVGLHLYFAGGGETANLVNQHIFDLCSERIEALSTNYIRTCVDALRHEKVSVDFLIKWHGIESLFDDVRYIMFPNAFSISPAEAMINVVQTYDYPEERRRIEFKHLHELGCALFSLPPPWLKKSKSFGFRFFHMERRHQFRDKGKMEPPSLSSYGFFGAFAILAIWLESIQHKAETHDTIDHIRKSRLPLFSFVRWLILARFVQVDTNKVQTEMDRCGFTAEQKDFAWQWIRREVHLVGEKKA